MFRSDMTSTQLAPWGKADTKEGVRHHLAHHCMDVAACFEAMIALPVVKARLDAAAGRQLSPIVMARLAVLCFLHDAGKLSPGFQGKGWPDLTWPVQRGGHVLEGAGIFIRGPLEPVGTELMMDLLASWGESTEALLLASISHHGRPFRQPESWNTPWPPVKIAQGIYDPLQSAREIGAMLRRWFPLAWPEGGEDLPDRPAFQHFYAGLVALADWIGSDRRLFPFVDALDPAYAARARHVAADAMGRIGLDVQGLQPLVSGRTSFTHLTGFDLPRPAQAAAARIDGDERLVILEAETGSGKTEAALWRFIRLFERGAVDSLYFALPTRAAAVQLHRRVQKALDRVFGAAAPEAVLAVPGYMRSGTATGMALPDWRVRWDDEQDADEGRLLARWAAESGRRYLAAMVAVGTVDQAMMAALKVKHAHLRGAALARSLLVIDEVHASDAYMTGIQTRLLDHHLERGGHALLMSATLGAVARSQWLKRRLPDLDQAVEAPYPAVWRNTIQAPEAVPADGRPKRVSISLMPGMEAAAVAAEALTAARAGARVLVIRNTVDAAVDCWTAIRDAQDADRGAEDQEAPDQETPDLLMQLAGGPALHHGRFAAEDRVLLDQAVEAALSPDDRRPGGVIVIGTQTLEQSLDIDADLLLTDLCPIDVLLQRLGRLHRHLLWRPAGFERPRCRVMVPADGLSPLLAPAFENGLGGWVKDGVLQGIYRDLSILELTRRLILDHPVWEIPAMNRYLVEQATHPDRIDRLHGEGNDDRWARYRNRVTGADIAKTLGAGMVTVRTDQDWVDLDPFPTKDEERIRTRLGEEGARIVFPEPVPGPFGALVSEVVLPAHWHGPDLLQTPMIDIEPTGLRIRTGEAALLYDRRGVHKEK